MGLTQSMSIATRAMAAMQTGLTVVSQNVANVSTEGYHKQRVNFKDSVTYAPATTDPASIVTTYSGVDVASIERYSTKFMQSYYWNENNEKNYLSAYGTMASQLEDLVNEMNGAGLANSFSKFYEAATALNSNPSDLTARQNYVAAAGNLCDTFNSLAGNLDSLQQGTNGTLASVSPSKMSDNVDGINKLLADIASVNETYMKTKNDSLLDKREGLINQLSEKINFTTVDNPNGTINISIGGTPLVKGTQQVTQLVAKNEENPTNGNIETKIIIESMEGQTVVEDASTIITGGSLKAALDLTGSDVGKLNFSGVRSYFDTLAAQVAATMNEIQTGDPKGDGTTPMKISVAADGTKTLAPADTTKDFFVTKDGTTTVTASNISINDFFKTSPYEIAAARIDTSAVPASDYQYAIGNNANATLMVETRSGKHASLDGMTFENFVATNSGKVGYQIADLNDKLDTQNSIVAGIENKMASDSGVSLDEELSDMLRYQQAYKAAARVFSVCNDLIGVLLEMG